jgi:glycosyltransferase involved in cell wall biosynthesis
MSISIRSGQRILYFWCDIITPHWLYTLAELAAELDVEVNVVAGSLELPGERHSFGWGETESLPDLVIKQYSAKLADEAVNNRNSHHLVTNPFNNKKHRLLVKKLRRAQIHYGIQNSMPGLISNPGGRFLRKMLYKQLFGVWLHGAEYILCHGEMTRTYFRKIGIPPGKLYVSGYFVPGKVAGKRQTSSQEKQLIKVIYLGQFIHRKAVTEFADGVVGSNYCEQRMVVDFAGAGPLRNELESRLKAPYGRVLPAVPYEQVIPFLENYDVLVLPSRADEWGVVVNEAIHAGCAVITTEKCGASDLVSGGKCGAVVKDASQCAEVLVQAIKQGDLIRKWQAATEALSSRITAKAGAHYLAEIITRKRSAFDNPPWGL